NNWTRMNTDERGFWDNKNKADHGTQKNTTRQSRNPKQVMLLENSCSALWVTPEIPPSPPFSKGGLGGISETRFPTRYSLQNLESLHARSTQIFNELDSKHLWNILITLTL
ncbi:MAG: hypothetical protein NTX30_16805, partial [Deltaproteobacteria bacterium]|nr:hypothetical protein [Deltaproteobacteria bacterium]